MMHNLYTLYKLILRDKLKVYNVEFYPIQDYYAIWLKRKNGVSYECSLFAQCNKVGNNELCHL
jgi:hypothetical protein